MNLLDKWGLTLRTEDDYRRWVSLRQILQAVAEDEEALKLIGRAINEAPRVSTIECYPMIGIEPLVIEEAEDAAP